jgi:hypothetical protein
VHVRDREQSRTKTRKTIAIYETVGISRIHDRNLFTKNEDVQREPGSSAYHVSMLRKYLRMVAGNVVTHGQATRICGRKWQNRTVVPGSSGELRCRRFPMELRERERYGTPKLLKSESLGLGKETRVSSMRVIPGPRLGSTKSVMQRELLGWKTL